MKTLLQWRKVVTAQEMARVEKIAIAHEQELDSLYMQRAGEAIAAHVEKICLDKVVTVIAGKGNKGGDGYTAAALLRKKGFRILVYQLYPLEECSPLCRERAGHFLEEGGDVILGIPSKSPMQGMVLDAILGTGFTGTTEGIVAKAICTMNSWHLPIVSIDIASGVAGDSGRAADAAIFASHTIALGAYKVGHFLEAGFHHAGEVTLASFGMAKQYLDMLEPQAYVVSRDIVHTYWPKRERTAHKYSIGQVIGFAGSPSMGGAAMLAMSAALRTGAGIVKLFHPPGMEGELSTAPYELIKSPWNDQNKIDQELQRSKSVIVGPGIGKAAETKAFLEKLMPRITVPMVVDGDALFFYPSLPKSQGAAILTPHQGELKYLHDDPQKFADQHQVTLVVKGAPTQIFHPGEKPLLAPYGTAGMATAGSGDVLTGMIGALLARGLEPRLAATMGVVLHQLAGEEAAKRLSEDFMCASDIIASLQYIPTN